MRPYKLDPIIVVGCGRVGAELAISIDRQHHALAVMDANPRAFDRLSPEFKGRTVQGDALDQDALRRAGIEQARGLAAVTSSDSANIITARIARDIFHVEHVVARVYEPQRMPIYERLGLQAIASSSWGATRIEQLLLHPGLQSVYSAGNGEVQIYEITVPERWNGRRLSDLLPAGEALAVALARGGRAVLPGAASEIQAHDILQVSASSAGAAELRRLLNEARKG
ncbi:MAG: TrkA family potassium uptake protein [Anaerolineales bacterium]|nr:TrkA family potassium uptake protein [Anaerolineales bacterium]